MEVVDTAVTIHLRFCMSLWNGTTKANTSPTNKEKDYHAIGCALGILKHLPPFKSYIS